MRMFLPLAAQAWKALAIHPLRTALAMLGMIVGVGSVVVMLAVAQGSQERVRQVMRSLGTNVLVVSSGAPTAGGVRQASGATPTITLGDVAAIAEMPLVRAVSPTTCSAASSLSDSRSSSRTTISEVCMSDEFIAANTYRKTKPRGVGTN